MVQIVHVESTAEDQGSEVHGSNCILVVRVKERSVARLPLATSQSNHILAILLNSEQ